MNPSPITNKQTSSKAANIKKYMTATTKNPHLNRLKKLENFEILGSHVIDATAINIHKQSSNSSEIEKQNKLTENEIHELVELRNQYNDLLKKYSETQKTMAKSIKSYIERTNPSDNPYLGKNIVLGNNQRGYVTDYGVYKPYIENSEGGIGCPVNFINVNQPPGFRVGEEGSIINTTPNLLVGKPMKKGQSCGNEGTNVYVSQFLPAVAKDKYLGCFSDKINSRTMTSIGDSPPIQYIINGSFLSPTITPNSYQYINSDLDVEGWHFNAVLINSSSAWGYVQPYPAGNQAACIQGISQKIYQIMNIPSGLYNLSFFSSGRPGFISNPIQILLNNVVIKSFIPPIDKWAQYTIPITIKIDGQNTIAFQGTIDKDASSAIQNITMLPKIFNPPQYSFDLCKNEAINTGFQYFSLQDIDQTKGVGYCFVGNDISSIQKNGNGSCASINDGKNGGLYNSNAVYNLGFSSFPKNMGKLGYVNSDGELSEYQDSMISYKNKYTKLENINSADNDISGETISDTTVASCETKCNSLVGCSGFAFDNTTKTCFPKNGPGIKTTLLGYDLYMRSPAIKNENATCNKEIKNIDSVQYEHYMKTGNLMSASTTCSEPQNSLIKKQLEQIQQQLDFSAQQIHDKIEELKKRGLNTQQQIIVNNQAIGENDKEYSKISKKEGFIGVNYDESQLKIINANYEFFIWSSIAISVLFIFFNTRNR
jgi:hypothetical protein